MENKTGFAGTVCQEGGSLKLYLPAPIADYLGIKAGDQVKVRVEAVRKLE